MSEIPADDPMRQAQRLMRPELPKRFYKSAEAAEENQHFTVHLDGRPIRTPARQAIALPSRALAIALAEEWMAQGERIDPLTMPLTRLVNVAIDGVTGERNAVADEIVKYAGSDLLCYRAEAPEGLVLSQSMQWDPVLAWARDDLDLSFVLVQGISFTDQPEPTLDRIRELVAPLDPLRLAALHTIMTLTGSALLAIAVFKGRLTADEAWAAAHVDEDWNMQLWGRDEEAMIRRSTRFAEMSAAHRLLALLD
ncbi:ATPase [Agaricicola taiwanensis]|uniref:ATPase n=1 Tax=Agaricicola taiwanensis TaxID=591372 RepID=A0A8J3DYI7_9RHOB|nr:ATP12 family protein [Agaricicola taiwanensis]GGE47380.1 ATPase [Agaricicola taiwanensis]